MKGKSAHIRFNLIQQWEATSKNCVYFVYCKWFCMVEKKEEFPDWGSAIQSEWIKKIEKWMFWMKSFVNWSGEERKGNEDSKNKPEELRCLEEKLSAREREREMRSGWSLRICSWSVKLNRSRRWNHYFWRRETKSELRWRKWERWFRQMLLTSNFLASFSWFQVEKGIHSKMILLLLPPPHPHPLFISLKLLFSLTYLTCFSLWLKSLYFLFPPATRHFPELIFM